MFISNPVISTDTFTAFVSSVIVVLPISDPSILILTVPADTSLLNSTGMSKDVFPYSTVTLVVFMDSSRGR